MQIQVQKEISIPVSGGLTGQLRRLEIGDSFLFPLSKRNTIATSANQAGIKCKTQKISDTECRVWRII